MAQNAALLHAGKCSAKKMQVGAADRAGRNAHNRVGRLLNFRLGHVLQGDITDAAKNDGFHRNSPFPELDLIGANSACGPQADTASFKNSDAKARPKGSPKAAFTGLWNRRQIRPVSGILHRGIWFRLCMKQHLTVVVTGASAGLGRAIAHAFGREGASVALISRDTESLETTAVEVRSLGGEALPITADVSNDEAVEAAASRVEEQFGP